MFSPQKKDKAVISSVNPSNWLLQNLGKLPGYQREVKRERKVNSLGERIDKADRHYIF